MRTASASIIALAALGLAEELKPNDVPLACAVICGPVVDLSTRCTPAGSNQDLKRRKLDHAPRALGGGGSSGSRTPSKAKRQLVPGTSTSTRVIGQFKTIPTPQPELDSGDVNAPQIDLRPTNTPTIINPVVPSPLPPPDAPQAEVPPAAPTLLPPSVSTPGLNLPIGNGGVVASPTDLPAAGGAAGEAAATGGVTSDTGSIKDGAGALWPGQKQKTDEGQEMQCFCTNNSFDVARVAALCSGCISQMGDDKSPMVGIMSMCNFTTEEEYEPAKDSVVANVRVTATSAAKGRARPAAELLAMGLALCAIGWAEALF